MLVNYRQSIKRKCQCHNKRQRLLRIYSCLSLSIPCQVNIRTALRSPSVWIVITIIPKPTTPSHHNQHTKESHTYPNKHTILLTGTNMYTAIINCNNRLSPHNYFLRYHATNSHHTPVQSSCILFQKHISTPYVHSQYTTT